MAAKTPTKRTTKPKTTTKTPSGFEFEINKDALDNWEFLEKLSDLEDGDDAQIVGIARILLGKEGVERLKEHVRDEKGKVTFTAMTEELTAVFEAVKSSSDDVKN